MADLLQVGNDQIESAVIVDLAGVENIGVNVTIGFDVACHRGIAFLT
jgi:hypothetical protein